MRLGRYRLLEKIGQGGMAEVYAARLEGPQMFARNCVIKRLRPELAKQPQQAQLFMEEARLSAMLQHPCLVQVFDVGEGDDGQMFFAMERVDGPSLARLVEVLRAQGEHVPVDVAAYIGARVAEGLHFAHEIVDVTTGKPLHIAHRDVSPHNILLGMAGDVKVADFGIAKADVEHRPQTRFGITKGKLAYMSPEQARGEKVDRRTDVYALGVVLWELFAGQALVPDRAHRRLLEQGKIERPSTLRKEVDAALDEIVLWALEPQAKDRTPTCRAVEDALDKWLLEHGPSARAKLQRLLRDKEPLFASSIERTNTAAQLAQLPPPPNVNANVNVNVNVNANVSATSRAVTPNAPTVVRKMDVAASGGTRVMALDEDAGENSGDDGGGEDEASPFESERTVPTLMAAPHTTPDDPSRASSSSLHGEDAMPSTIVAGRAAVPLPNARGNVPPSSTSFVGRSAELEAVRARFDEGARVVTLVAPGGTGKTRIALQFADEQSSSRAFPGGVWFVDLTGARDASTALAAIARALGVPLRGGRTHAEALTTLGHALAASGRALVVVDACDDLGSNAGDVLTELSRRCPRARFLATSQQMLNVAGESVLDVPPLPVPAAGADDLSDEGAVELFLQRARSARNGHALSESARGVVVEIVRKLDGVPLAIELAAARAATETPSEILARLSANAADARTLKAAIGETYEKLADDEKRAFRQASVFRGGFDLEAADAIFDLGDDARAVDALERLKGRSLIVARPSTTNAVRYSMLAALRAFAGEKLEQALEKSAAEARHAGYYVSLGKKLAADVDAKYDGRAEEKLNTEVENLTAVIERARNQPRASTAVVTMALEAALALDAVVAQRASASEQLALLDRALSLADGKGVAARVLLRGHIARGEARRLVGAFDQARADVNAALDLASKEGDANGELRAELGLGAIALSTSKLGAAEDALSRALLLAEGARDDVNAARALAQLGKVSRLRRRLDESEQRCRRAIELFARVGHQRGAGRARVELASTLLTARKLDDAAHVARDAVDALTALGDRRSLVHAWGTRAVIDLDRKRFDDAESAAARAVDAAVKVADRKAEGLYLGMRASALHAKGALLDARERYAEAARTLFDVGDDAYGAFFAAALGAVHAALDDLDAAAQSFAWAERRIASADRPLLAFAVSTFATLLERARAGDAATQRRARDAMKARVDEARAPGGAFEHSEEVRFAVRIVQTALGQA